MHFTYLLKGAEQMIHTGKPTWPAERTLLTSGMLDAAAAVASTAAAKSIPTPYLNVAYQSDWNWQMPPAPPPRTADARAIAGVSDRRDVSV